MKTSESYFQSILDFAWTAVARSLAKRLVTVGCKIPCHYVDRTAEAWAGRIADVAGNAGNPRVCQIAGDSSILWVYVWRVPAELHLVEQVEELHAELQCHPFRELEVLVEREVCIG